jgi:4'-phosphopantetheinyl transferase
MPEERPRAGLVCPGKVDLWHVELDRLPVTLREILSVRDWQEARQITPESERETFLQVRSAIRSLLAGYLPCAPEDLKFEQHAGGLHLSAPSSLLRFHHSHSANLLLVAVSFARQVGLDVEFMRDDLPFETLADCYFDPRDARQLRHLAHSDRIRHFYQEWTSSEATRHVETHARRPTGGARRWSLLNFTPARGFSAALAVEGGDFQLDWRRWS